MKLASLEAAIRVLNAADVPFIVVGGLAVNAHGYPRFTNDVDLVIRLEPSIIRRAFAALDGLGYAPRVPVSAAEFSDEATRQKWMREKGMQVLSFHSDRHRETPIDVFVQEPFDFDDEYANAFSQEISAGVPVRVVRLATLVTLKRKAARPQDLADLEELRRLHGTIGNDP